MGGGSMLEAFYPAVEASEDGDGSRPGSAMSPMNRTMTGARLLYSPRAVPSWQAGLGLTAGGAKPPPRRQGAAARVKPASSVDKAVDRLTTDGFSAKKTLSPVRSQNASNSNSSCAQLNYSRWSRCAEDATAAAARPPPGRAAARCHRERRRPRPRGFRGQWRFAAGAGRWIAGAAGCLPAAAGVREGRPRQHQRQHAALTAAIVSTTHH